MLPDEADEPDDAMNSNNLSTRFTHLTTRLTHFWNRWLKEYLADLREFHKVPLRVKRGWPQWGKQLLCTRIKKNEGVKNRCCGGSRDR